MHHIYPDGNEAYIIDIVFLCNDFSGKPVCQESECLDLKWFDINDLPKNISPPVVSALGEFVAQHSKFKD